MVQDSSAQVASVLSRGCISGSQCYVKLCHESLCHMVIYHPLMTLGMQLQMDVPEHV